MKRGKGRILDCRGITGIEIVMVIVVLTLLVALVLPVAIKYFQGAGKATCSIYISEVKRYYMAVSASRLYEVEDSLPVLTEALAEAGGQVLTEDSYEAPCGGVCTVTYSENRAFIRSVYCSRHGESEAEPVTNASAATELARAVDTADAGLLSGGEGVWSDLPDARRTAVLDGLPPSVAAWLDDRTWAVIPAAEGDFSVFHVYIYDGSIADKPAGERLDVMEYDAGSGAELGVRECRIALIDGRHRVLLLP